MTPRRWPTLRTFKGDDLRCVALPLGGIGTGTVSLGGRGDLRDWEVGARPAKGFAPRHAFFAIRVRPRGARAVTRVLEGPVLTPFDGWVGSRAPHPGLPRFRRATFAAAYPLARVRLADPDVPAAVHLEAFNPLVPGDADASGIPVAVLRWVVRNPSPVPAEVAVCGSLQNVVGALHPPRSGMLGLVGVDLGPPTQNVNEVVAASGPPPVTGVLCRSDGVSPDAEMFGTLALATTAPARAVTARSAWADVPWGDTLADFWDDFAADGRLEDRERGGADKPTASVAVSRRLAPGETGELTFLLAWHFPNRMSWTPAEGLPWVTAPAPGSLDRPAGEANPEWVGNHYATRYGDAWEVAERTAADLPALEAATVAFVSDVSGADLPHVVKEAALSTLPALRSQTSFRTADGRFFGWEGTGDDFGCCPGSCTHVWNYEQATAFLFADLARSLRETEFLHSTRDDGHMSFRAHLPIGRAADWGVAAADGQTGCLMKLYRDWQLSGDDAWLRRLWPRARAALEFCWVPGGWDADRDGVMEGAQHNTMDCEYFGPNPLMGLWYLGALRAAEEMARHLGETDFAAECRRLFQAGSAWLDTHLFNGEYYEHDVRPPASPDAVAPGLVVPVFGEAVDLAHPRSQLGPGCLVDQLAGQYMAHVCGLGYLVQPAHVRTTLRSVMKYNFRRDFHDHVNDKRSYVAPEDAGLLMASYPRGRPQRPFTYADEVMTGFEYTAAVGMLYEGATRDGLRCMEAVRARYDGRRRNPFDEAECGHHYSRAMASWAAILALTGFHWSGIDGHLRFRAAPEAQRWFWSNGSAWGVVAQRPRHDRTAVTLTVRRGQLPLRRLTLSGAGSVDFDPTRTLTTGDTLRATVPHA